MTPNAHGGAGSPGGRRAGGALESEILAVLRETAPQALTPGEVRTALGGALSYSTVVTTLSRLHDKDVLTRTPRGRAFAYAPADDEPGLAARKMRHVLENEPDREAVLSRFVDDLTTGDEQLLRRLLGADLDPGQ
ncbi:Predicted transcriptional regulator [Streptosporangium subroseum]|uniref:Predicted transcriptional regulator n=1 Tax=Streptosporangium subroseum TaxID=106412 RepID=A0A239LVZ8_9ACTN|nr:BlaI/MecI/CopY family transcriptional regulator [Streptosporangium subroseum]SNT33794.1 Predicted transcriptional regulator [Streptosporangium subroseum]